MADYEIIKDRAKVLLESGKTSKLYSYLESYAWYSNNKDSIKLQIQDRLWQAVVHSRRDIKRKIKSYPYINKIPKSLDRLCNLYGDPPQRYIKIKDKIDDDLTKAYNDRAKEIKLNEAMQENHKLAMFYNTVLVGPYFEGKNLYIRTYLPFEYFVIPKESDKSRIDVLLLLNVKEISPQKFEKSVIVWTEKEHYIINSELISEPIPNNSGKENPYKGVIPFLSLRMKRDNYDFQGNGLEWMVESCLAASVNRVYTNYLIPFCVGGIFVAKKDRKSVV